MSFRAWVIAVAFGIIAGLGQAQEQTDRPQGEAETQQEPTGAYPVPFPVVVVEDQATADARKRGEDESSQREIEDLAAQQGMNAATQAMNRTTQRMAEYAFWSTVFVAVGTALLVITLLLTWQANRAAVFAGRITQRIGEAQVRAYLHCKSAKYKLSKESISAIVEFENTGQSPANVITISGGVTLHDVGGFPHMPRVMSWLSSRDSKVSCQPTAAGGSSSEEIIFFWDMDFPVGGPAAVQPSHSLGTRYGFISKSTGTMFLGGNTAFRLILKAELTLDQTTTEKSGLVLVPSVSGWKTPATTAQNRAVLIIAHTLGAFDT